MKHKFLQYLMIALLALPSEICFANSMFNCPSDLTEIGNEAQIVVKQAQPHQRFTREMYNKIRRGMSYQQCVQILGSEGTLQSSSESAIGVMEMYKWVNDDRSVINLTFINYRLDSKHFINY